MISSHKGKYQTRRSGIVGFIFGGIVVLLAIAAGSIYFASNARLNRMYDVAVKSWNEPSFIRAMREGKRPNGSTISPIMPWQDVGKLSDDELHAIWLYLQSVPAS